MHIKKTKMPKSWPIARKGRGKRFIAVPSHANNKGITILYILRDILKIASTRKEAKKILFQEDVTINNKVRKEDTFPVQVFDTLSLAKANMHYRLEIVNKKFELKEITAKEAEQKIVKIIGKKTLKQNKIQMNLEDGSNVLSKEKFNVGDSIILNTKTDKIVKVLKLQKGATVEIVLGKHAGKKGKLIEFEELKRGKDFLIKLEDKTEVSLPYKTILVIA
jgi:small subunit ribosomal protein S4e